MFHRARQVMNADDTDLQIQNVPIEFLDPCKSVVSALSVVGFGGFCAKPLRVQKSWGF
jgi:hypothetical protein